MIDDDDPCTLTIDESALVSIRAVAEQMELMACIATRADRLIPCGGGDTVPAMMHLPASALAITFRQLATSLFSALEDAEAIE